MLETGGELAGASFCPCLESSRCSSSCQVCCVCCANRCWHQSGARHCATGSISAWIVLVRYPSCLEHLHWQLTDACESLSSMSTDCFAQGGSSDSSSTIQEAGRGGGSLVWSLSRCQGFWLCWRDDRHVCCTRSWYCCWRCHWRYCGRYGWLSGWFEVRKLACRFCFALNNVPAPSCRFAAS